VDDALQAGGWRVYRHWEHEPPELVAESIARVVARLRREASLAPGA
jgi:hypothetical protein